ncbi:MAG: DNA methyltransferase [Segetibacter sp.]
MPLSWNEIKSRAVAFSQEWKDEVSEDAEAKSFWDDFFTVLGISRRRVATFEQQVKKLDHKAGFIDLLWKGVILIEHKSRGKDLDKAYAQAKDYFPGLTDKELPNYILVSDFERFRLYDLEAGIDHKFKLSELVDNIHLFGFIAGYQKRTYKEQDPVNIEAAELMGKLHDRLKAIGYDGHALELYLVRLLFCLFADDTNIFEKGIFYDYVDLRTNVDGSDLAMHLDTLFSLLNTSKDKRYRNLDEALSPFPYVNGKLFEERLPAASFDSPMRKILMDLCLLDWGKISPAIFGSLFQSVMDEKARRNLGAHYTSEKNILKLIKPLFLDDLWKEFEAVKDNKNKLQQLHDKISRLRFLDPACGCGNFLIIAYRELRLLEIEIIKVLLYKHQKIRPEVAASAGMDIGLLIKCDVDRFYGIEYEEFPAQVAQVAMWLIDHQMNQLVSQTFGEYYVRLPLHKSATIVYGNALRTDWQSLIDPLPWEKGHHAYDYIMGNPPFVGKQYQNNEQKADMLEVFKSVNSSAALDYVSAWYIIAGQYLQHKSQIANDILNIKCAFVSTNSITQGEQVAILWNELFNKYKIKIHFAHRTFKWINESKGYAGVHVVIVGFSNYDVKDKSIYFYDNVKGEPHQIAVKNINPYLVEGKDEFVVRRKTPISKVPELIKGNQPTDEGNYLFTSEEKRSFLMEEPNAAKYFRQFIGSPEFINSIERWCLWLKDITPNELKQLPKVYERVQKVRLYRLKSPKSATVKKAETPTLFDEIRHTDETYLVIPEVSSERRKYLPIGYINANVISSNKNYMLPNATLYHFGILNSIMHNIWTHHVSGRLESRIQYSNGIVYNNFPWAENPTEKQIQAVESSAQAVLDARTMFPDASLADLYDPNTMPPVLVKAHQALDKAVDLCYRPQPFLNETKRIEFLFELYDKYTAGMFVKEKKMKKKIGT